LEKYSTVEAEIVEEIKNLPLPEQKKILDIVRLVKSGLRASRKKHSITELKGCGKEIWKGIDAQEYVNKLRNEWN